jgi:hypothetical protein
MSVVNTLLKLDSGKLDLPTKQVEIKRLSEAAGEPVVFTLKGISASKIDEIRDMATRINGDKIDVDRQEMRMGTVVAGTIDPDFRDKQLMDHFGVKTPYDLVKKMLTAGEIDTLYEKISELTGYNEDAVEEVKKP